MQVVYSNVYMLDDGTTWKELPPMPKPDSHIEFAWVNVNNSLIIAGGTTDKHPITKKMVLVGEVFRFNLDTLVTIFSLSFCIFRFIVKIVQKKDGKLEETKCAYCRYISCFLSSWVWGFHAFLSNRYLLTAFICVVNTKATKIVLNFLYFRDAEKLRNKVVDGKHETRVSELHCVNH